MGPITTSVALVFWTLTLIALGLMTGKALRHGQLAEAGIIFLMMCFAFWWAVSGVHS